MCRTTWKQILRGVCAIATLVAAIPHENVLGNAPPGIAFKVPKTSRHRAPAKLSRPSQNTIRIQGFTRAKTNSRSVAAVLGAHQRQVGGFGYENVTSANAYGTQYAVSVLWDGFPVSLLVDTGSSDTWVVHKSFLCIDYSGQIVSQGACAFGPVYPGDFSSGLVVPRQHMYIQYGDGEIVTGPMGYSDITLGNVTVKRQQSCLANSTYWFGNNVTSGLMGLAFPSLTNSYLGTDDNHDPVSQVEYSPLFTSMVNQGKVAPLFSIAIDRNASTGVIAWGGVPDTAGLDPSRTATLDMIIASSSPLQRRPLTPAKHTALHRPTSPTSPSRHTNTHSTQSSLTDGNSDRQQARRNIHTLSTAAPPCAIYHRVSNPSLSAPRQPRQKKPEPIANPPTPDLAEAISQAFTPAAVYLWMYGAYFTSCDAIAPIIAVILGGIKFFINTVDLIYRGMRDPLTGLCMIGISSGGSGPYILGDVFMQNALVVFDVGEAKMRFIPREFYS